MLLFQKLEQTFFRAEYVRIWTSYILSQILILGEVNNGNWDKRFGPSGRSKWYKYNITEIETSPVATAFRRNNISFPSPQVINETRENISLSCDWDKESNVFFT